MSNKEYLYRLLVEDDGQNNELELGEKLGLTPQETQEVIAQLLSEFKIEFLSNRNCNYKVVNKPKK